MLQDRGVSLLEIQFGKHCLLFLFWWENVIFIIILLQCHTTILLVPIPFQNSPIFFLSPQALMTHTTLVLLPNTDPVHAEKNRSVPNSPCIISLSREGSDTFLSTHLAHFPKTCGYITVCDFHPSYKHGYNWSMISEATGEYVRKEWEKTRKKHKSHFLRKSGLKKGNSLQLPIKENFLVVYSAKEISKIFYLFTTSRVGFKLSFGELRSGKATTLNKTGFFLLMYLEAFGWLVKNPSI